uniref:Three-finger toxin 1 n=1 Tax=Micrurus tener TaxID=1114301 RepID=A0A194ATB7_9SAUR
MKTLLFTLAVVGFISLDLVKSLECYTCGKSPCTMKTCSKEEKFCHLMVYPGSLNPKGGCTQECPKETTGMLVICRTTNIQGFLT